MADTNINILLQQLEKLQWKQESLRLEMEALKNQLTGFAAADTTTAQDTPPPIQAAAHTEVLPETAPQEFWPTEYTSAAYDDGAAHLGSERKWRAARAAEKAADAPQRPVKPAMDLQHNLEKFIGENLINKIGIIITVIGVAIGAKYSIEHELISPLTRIILGYLSGLGLLGFAIYLKQKHHDFSAVLLSGAMAIMYFITFAAYSLYGLFPQLLSFALMLLFTCFTVVAALTYNRQVIAHIGLVGAYAVPFLLSDGSGRVHILFSYMAIINTGILVIAFKRYWKPLYYVAFCLSWLIFLGWYGVKFQTSEHFGIAFLFASLFFLIFYGTFLAYKMVRREVFGQVDVLLLLTNSFIFYGVGYNLLDDGPGTSQFVGLFTILNAVVHFVVCVMIYRLKLADKNLFYLMAGLVLVFITIAVPVQLDGNWVTLLWSGEAALLFWIGRSKGIKLYEQLAFPLMILALFSLVHDWSDFYVMNIYDTASSQYRPLLNSYFLTSMLFLAAFGFMYWLVKRTPSSLGADSTFARRLGHAIGAVLLAVLYFSFELEISSYMLVAYEASHMLLPETEGQYNYHVGDTSLLDFKTIWILLYSISFLCLLALANLRRLQHKLLALCIMGLSAVVLLAFLIFGLEALNELAGAWLQPKNAEYFPQGIGNLLIRYLTFAFIGLLLWANFSIIKQYFASTGLRVAYDFVLGGTLLWISSNELLHWMDLSGSTQSHKLGLSILWGIFALLVVVAGIRKNKKHLRMGAFFLLGITLLKLFAYDLSHLDTIAKTIVLVSLGVLLLIISFLYNKYKHLITDASPE